MSQSPSSNNIHWIGVFALLALCAGIAALILAASLLISQEQPMNLASVPGQTNVAGGLTVNGSLTCTSTNHTPGALVVQGAIQCADEIRCKCLDQEGELHIGSKKQTGLTIGRSGIPTKIKGRQVESQSLIPLEGGTYNLGQKEHPWQNVYTHEIHSDIFVNQHGFPCFLGGGVYVLTSPILFPPGKSEEVSLFSFAQAKHSTKQSQCWSTSQLSPGDTFAWDLHGKMESTCEDTVCFSFSMGSSILYSIPFLLSSISSSHPTCCFAIRLVCTLFSLASNQLQGTISCYPSTSSTKIDRIRPFSIPYTEECLSWDVKMSASHLEKGSLLHCLVSKLV